MQKLRLAKAMLKKHDDISRQMKALKATFN